MSLLELRKVIFGVVLAFTAVFMLSACSSTEEAPPPEDSGSCEEQCGGDPDCLEQCIQNLNI